MNSGDAGAGGWGRFRRDPHPSLRAYVVEYWGMARDLGAMGGFTITPDGFGEMVCCVGGLHAVGAGGREALPTCFLLGLLREPLRVEADGVVRCASARLHPWAVGRLLADVPALAAGGWADAGIVFGPRLDDVAGRVGRGDWPGAAGLFDDALVEAAGRWGCGGGGADEVAPFLAGGPRPTAEAAVRRETSTRQVERRVRRLTGTSPKQLACLARFQKARDALWADPSASLARLAADAGYADQAHLTRDFRRYAGLTPSRFAREAATRAGRPAAGDVAFVQDRAEADG